jgi:hypothetical protein
MSSVAIAVPRARLASICPYTPAGTVRVHFIPDCDRGLAAALGGEPPPEWDTKGGPPVNGVSRAASDFREDGEAVGW